MSRCDGSCQIPGISHKGIETFHYEGIECVRTENSKFLAIYFREEDSE